MSSVGRLINFFGKANKNGKKHREKHAHKSKTQGELEIAAESRGTIAAAAASSSASSQEEVLPGDQPAATRMGGVEGLVDPREAQSQPVAERFSQSIMNFEPIVTINMDETFARLDPKIAFPVPEDDKIWAFVESPNLPRINLSENPSAVSVLRFLKQFEEYTHVKNERNLRLIYDRSFVGIEEKTWATMSQYDFPKIKQMFLNWMWRTESWIQTMVKLRHGERFHDSPLVHIEIFNLVAMHMGLRAEDELTKSYLARSVGLGQSHICDANGRLIPYERLIAIAGRSIFIPSQMDQVKDSVSATTLRSDTPREYHNGPRPYDSHMERGGKKKRRFYKTQNQFNKPSSQAPNSKKIRCRLCKGIGHMQKDCPFQKTKSSKQKPNKKNRDDEPDEQVNAIGDDWDGLIHCDGHNGHNIFNTVLDCGATINCVNKDILDKLEGTIIPTNKTIRVLRNVQEVTKCIEMKIRIGRKEDVITAYVVEGIPGEILIGNPFLLEHSEGLNIMIKEFGGRINFPKVCTVAELDGLQALLVKYPGLVLEEGEMPDPNRYYKGQTFHLGIPEDKRDTIYYRGQYQFDPALIDKYREVMEPLIESGVFRKSDSPHNNPVLLVPKKTPGQYRLVIDNRLVNAVCRPVGSMRASPLQIIRAIVGASIFTTADCKNAFF